MKGKILKKGFRCRTSLLHRSRSSGRDFAGWTNPFLGQYLHPSPLQSSRSIQRMQTVLIPKQILYDHLNKTKKETIFMEEQSLLHRSRSSGRDFARWTNSFLGQYLHPSPVQSSRSIQRMQTVLVPKHIFMYCDLLVKIAWKKRGFESRTSLCFTDQEAQEEILLSGPTPSWVSTYTHLLYKAQDPFSACRQSWFLNTFLCTAIYW